jgi:tetratricopeptide (TPR) repeat protein
VQVARAYRDDTPEDVRRKQYEPYAAELQRIFPGLRDLFPNLPEPSAETEEGQFRLFDAFSAFARSVAVETPLVLVLDDLHWADGATLGLLTHLARELARARILVVGTYRDTDLDRRHPLATALAELGREDLFSRISLRGLSLAETEEYLRQAANVEPARELVARIFEETEGNPFFLSEVVNLMTEEGSFAADSVSDIAVPEGVRQALGRRLDRLSEDANELLTVLAVAGRDFEHALVQSLSTHDDATTLHLLEEALRARVLEEVGAGRYRFTHALMQETLLAELSAARRVLLHGQIAEAMERLYREERDYVAAIAEHYRESAALNAAHARGATRYLRLAAELAAATLAYGEAAQYYERCIELVRGAPDGLGEEKAALWTELAFCRMLMGEVPRGWGACEEALAEVGNPDPVARLRILARVASAAPIPAIRYSRALLEEALTVFGAEPAPEACTLLALIACADPTPGGDAAAAAADEMARTLELAGADYPWLLKGRPARAAIERGDFEDAFAESERVEAEALGSWASERSHLVTMFMAALYSGDISRLVPIAQQIIKRAHECGDRGIEQTWSASLARIDWLRGAAPVPQYGPEVQAPGPHFPKVMAVAHALEQGDSELALHSLPSVEEEKGWSAAISGIEGLRAAALLALGDTSSARTALERWLVQFEKTSLLEERAVCAAGDPLCALADDAVLQRVSESYLERYPAMRYWPPYSSGPDQVRGAIALRLGHVDEAERHFRTGLEWATRPDVRFWLDEGRCRQGLAEVAERRGDHALAMQHLDAAGELFAKHGAKLYLDQVLAKKEILKA